jgi:purine catabolism regulator
MLTVQDIINLDLMNRVKIKTAHDTLTERTVEGVSVIEIPVENFVRENEFVLSTAVGCGHNPKLLKKFVEDIFISRAAALALATGPHISTIPQNVLHFADQHRFPVIEIPWELRFADISQTILQKLYERRQKAAEQSEKIQQQLLNLILHGGDLSGIAQFIYEKTKQPTVIVDSKDTIRGKSRDTNDLTENRNDHVKLKHSKYLKKIPIRSASQIQGSIVVLARKNANYTLHEKNLLEHAATAAALWFLRENAVKETEIKIRGDFILDLAKGKFQSWDSARSRARSLKFDIDLSYVCLLGKIDNGEVLSLDNQNIQNTVELIHNLGNIMGRKVMITSLENMLVLFLETEKESVMETIHMFFRQLDEKLSTTNTVISWGIGENHVGIGTFRESYHAALSALDIGIRQKGLGHRTMYGDTSVYRALSILSTNEEMRDIIHEIIGKLIDYRHEKNIDLLTTIREYTRHQANISKTARSLHLHRQSLVYRLQKIETLTGRSFDDPDDRFLLELCTKMWEAGLSSSPE